MTVTFELTQDIGLDEDYGVTAEQVRSFGEHGWVSLPGFLSAEAVEAIRVPLAQLDFRPPPEPGGTVYVRDVSAAAASSLRKQEGLAWKHPFFRDLAISRRVAGAAVRLMGVDEALLVQDSSFYKPPGGGETSYHQDLPFFPFDRQGGITIWIALIDMEPDMGPLRYLDGSHREGPLGRFFGSDPREVYPALGERAVAAGHAMRAGDAQVHWDLTVHGAAANTSERAREAFTMRYIRADTLYTGSPHPHYSSFGMAPGSRFAEVPDFFRVGRD
ncbi:phytanoyl-CoA dioxygenase family protein [Pseudonocardia sp. NPDC049154]|uniref:phytanoyl-CoA dioxygenase family protein n=1 Tax=Pseudonocardia sp. NPDC049154 TaxID=3155501 RepID=UPI0033FE2937